MACILRYVIAILCCLAVIGGKAELRFYLHQCSHNNCSMRLVLQPENAECSHSEQKKCCGCSHESAPSYPSPQGVYSETCCSNFEQTVTLSAYDNWQQKCDSKRCALCTAGVIACDAAYGVQCLQIHISPSSCAMQSPPLCARNLPLRI